MIDDDNPALDEGHEWQNTYPQPDQVSEATRQYYDYRYRLLHRTFTRTRGYVVDADEMVAMLIENRKNYSMRYWRFLKATVMHTLLKAPHSNQMAIERLDEVSSKGLRTRSQKGSGRKVKRIPANVASNLVFDLLAANTGTKTPLRSKYSEATANIVLATIATGLRPSEWSRATIVSGQGADGSQIPVLRVRNGKYNSVRANGEFREIKLDRLTQEELDVIQNTIQEFAANADRLRQFIYDINREMKRSLVKLAEVGLIEKRFVNITLYSARHQFAADAKSANLPFRVVAAMLGHRSQKTASWHYARKQVGSGGVKVSPTPASIAAVNARVPRPTVDPSKS
jgi:integrase